jgi:hypothetical protein
MASTHVVESTAETVRSGYPAAPPPLPATAAITQKLSQTQGTWRITRRTVAPAEPSA